MLWTRLTGHVSEKTDAFAFGILLIELMIQSLENDTTGHSARTLLEESWSEYNRLVIPEEKVSRSRNRNGILKLKNDWCLCLCAGRALGR